MMCHLMSWQKRVHHARNGSHLHFSPNYEATPHFLLKKILHIFCGSRSSRQRSQRCEKLGTRLQEVYTQQRILYCNGSPNEIALTKMVKARMKMIRDALPNIMISFLTTCCPTKAAIVATITK